MNRKAFTLVEVLMALVITTTVLFIIQQGFTVGLGSISFSQKRTRASILMREIIAKLESGELETNVQLEEKFGHYPEYTYKIIPTPVEGLTNVDVYTVRVYWGNPDDQEDGRYLETVRMIYRIPASEENSEDSAGEGSAGGESTPTSTGGGGGGAR